MTHHPALRRVVVLAAASLALSTLPGCIVWEIRDQITEANGAIDQANQAIAQSNAGIEHANATLDRLDEQLAALRETNLLLQGLREDLKVLGPIDSSLKRLDGHLASLRKTIDNIDSTIPFLKIGGDPLEEDTPEDAVPGEGDAPATGTDSVAPKNPPASGSAPGS
ncbi:MAG: hypothetical protein KDA21_02615 [Phycisphaerales bacterium]|nr:hypothetical protein [Phycisphaerales bacterium]